MTITPEQLAEWRTKAEKALAPTGLDAEEWSVLITDAEAELRPHAAGAILALIAEVERLAPYDPPYCADCGTEHWPHDEKGHEVVSGSPSACQVKRLRALLREVLNEVVDDSQVEACGSEAQVALLHRARVEAGLPEHAD